MDNYYNVNNISLGVTLEEACKIVLSSVGYNVEDHKVTAPGVDVKAFKGCPIEQPLSSNEEKVIECLNWYGGYIHPLRFRSIVENLKENILPEKYLISFGVQPTKQQYRLLRGYGIKVIHYHKQIKAITKDVLKFLSKALGCYYYSSLLLSNITSSILFKIIENLRKEILPEKLAMPLPNSNSIIKWRDTRLVKEKVRHGVLSEWHAKKEIL